MGSTFIAIDDPQECQGFRLPEQRYGLSKICKLIYSHCGRTIIALNSGGIHTVWDVDQDQPSWSGMASFRPWKSSIRQTMMNTVVYLTSREAVVPCMTLSKDGILASASGGGINLFDTEWHKEAGKIMHIGAPTSILFHPQDRNIILLGMENPSILVYNIRMCQIIAVGLGHGKRVTGLATTTSGDRLVSTDAEGKIILWSFNGFNDLRHQDFKVLQLPQQIPTQPSDTLVEFHQNQTRVLVVHKLQLTQYDTMPLACRNQWQIQVAGYPFFSHATYSCDYKLVYAGFEDGTIFIFHAENLQPVCWISRRAYLPSGSPLNFRSVVIAAHPKRPNQIAVGVADDAVYVLEPRESQ